MRFVLHGLGMLAALCCLFETATVAAQGGVLTLAEALKAADAPHPELEAARAERSLAAAELELAGTRSDASLTLEGRLQRVQPALRATDTDFISDNSVRLVARKNLWDFGRTQRGEEAARLTLEARELGLMDRRDQRRLDIMARYFDVLLADLRYTVDNEYLAVAYVAFDQARDRAEQKLLSQVDVAELEARSQAWLVRRAESEKRQRLARALLADAMNRPGELPSELEDPALPDNERPLPDYEVLVAAMLENNPRLKAQQQLLAASQQRLEAIRAERNPRLDAELELADYAQRPLSGRDQVRAGVVLSWPFYQGRTVSAALAREQAQFQKLQAEREQLKRDLTQALLAAWLDADHLRRIARRAAKVEADFRDLALERARGQYEMEYRTNLGDSMAKTMEAKLASRSVEYRLALALAKIEALVGRPLAQLAQSKGAQP
ncbi:TolC family protein [Thiobacter aerophilum]|uniref:TolC family protein n=1 Tax=Thiobacter aerophilum TaxID=3121275 RepID=A0ABV0EHC6_9BURK